MGMRRFVTSFCADFGATIEDNRTEHILKTKPTIIVASNHISEFDPVFLLAALPHREDFFLVADVTYTRVSKNFDKHIIPVYIKNNTRKETGRRVSRIKTRLFKTLHPIAHYDVHKEHALNVKSIKTASERVDKGNLVTIFPGNKEKWYSGVGYLIKDVKNKKDSYVVMAKIEGATNFDTLRLIPILGQYLRKVRVTLSSPIALSEFEHEDGKKIAQYVEQKYKKWCNQTISHNVLFEQKANKLPHAFRHAKKALKVCLLTH